MKFLVPDETSFNGMKLVKADSRKPPEDAIAAWPEGMDEKYVEVVEVLFQKIRTDEGIKDITIVKVSPWLIEKKAQRDNVPAMLLPKIQEYADGDGLGGEKPKAAKGFFARLKQAYTGR